MSYTFSDELKYRQLTDDIKLCRELLKRRGLGFAIGRAAFAVALIAVISIAFEALFDKANLISLLRSQQWLKLLAQFLFWLVIFYFGIAKDPQRKLKRHEKELQRLLAKHPELKILPTQGNGS